MSAATSLPPGPRYPRALQTLGWIQRPMAFMEDCQRRYGDMFTLKVAYEGTWVFLAHPDLVKPVFTGDPRVLHAGEGNEVLGPVLGRRSVLLLDEQHHMTARKLLLPPFHGERMKRYGELMTAVAEREIDRWPAGVPVRLWPGMQAVTLEVIIRTVFGVQDADRLDHLRGVLMDLIAWTTEPQRLGVVAMIGPARLHGVRAFRRVKDRVDTALLEEIRRRRDAPDLSERDDVLSLLLQAGYEDGSAISDEELRDQLITLLVAGHETTATALAWALERLARHPAALARLREEVEAGEEAYLDAVIQETLRLRPVLTIVVRRLKEPMELGGHLLPAGATVTPCIYLIHRRPDIYPDPRAFRPERFLEQPPGTYTWIPFGGGVRRCLGASFALFEMKRVLPAILRRVELTPSRPEAERPTRRAITLTPGRGAEMVVRSRTRSRAPIAA